jgi:ATP-binding cassette subfamily C exporter for protease/lipase
MNLTITFPKFRSPVLNGLYLKIRGDLLAAALFTGLANFLMLTPTIYMLQVYDRIMISRSELTLYILTLFIVALYALLYFTEWIRARLMIYVGTKIDSILSPILFESLLHRQLVKSSHNPTQYLADATTARQWLTGTGFFSFFDLPWTPVYILVMFILHPLLGFLGCFFVFNISLLTYFSNIIISRNKDTSSQEQQELNSFIYNKMRNAEVIETHGMLQAIKIQWMSRQEELLSSIAMSDDIEHKLKAFVKFLRYFQQSLSLGAGAYLVIQDELSIGSMFAANVLMGRASAPLEAILSSWKNFIQAKDAILRVDEVIAEEIKNCSSEAQTIESLGDIEIKNLTITHENEKTPVLNAVTLKIRAGEITLLEGKSGAGKTTFIMSILGLIKITSGTINFNGVNRDNWNQDYLQSRVGYLPQDVGLLPGAISENIARYGEIDSKEVVRVAVASGVHNLILGFANGYDTKLGPGGIQLSGGQSQQVALARALYSDPELLILDEPDSNLDYVAQDKLKEMITNFRASGKTIIIISHRKSFRTIADRLFVFEDGNIRENPLEKDDV